MDNLSEGSIIAIPNITEGANIVLSTVEHNEKKYALITAVDGEINMEKYAIKSISFDITKAVVISYNKNTGEILYDSNVDIVKELIEKIAK